MLEQSCCQKDLKGRSTHSLDRASSPLDRASSARPSEPLLVSRAVRQNAPNFAASRSTEPLDRASSLFRSSEVSDVHGMLVFDLSTP